MTCHDIVLIQIQIAMNLIIMSKEFINMRSSKSQEFWLPVTGYPRAKNRKYKMFKVNRNVLVKQAAFGEFSKIYLKIYFFKKD